MNDSKLKLIIFNILKIKNNVFYLYRIFIGTYYYVRV